MTLLAVIAGGCATTGQGICSDYRSRINCVGGWRELHHGIDFRGPAGTEVISATHGTVVRKSFIQCAGHGLAIKTDMVARHDDIEGPVYAIYWHVEPFANLKVSQQVKPGDPLGKIIPLRHTKCYGSAEHVHFELRVLDAVERHINPHEFWVDGPGKVTCFTSGANAQPGKAVAPLHCPP